MHVFLKGIFGVAWSACELDGLSPAPVASLRTGMVLRLTAPALRLDDTHAYQAEDQNAAARSIVTRLLSSITASSDVPIQHGAGLAASHDADRVDVLSLGDGMYRYEARLVFAPHPVLVFTGDRPDAGFDLDILNIGPSLMTRLEAMAHKTPPPRQAVCFAPGARIATPDGMRDVVDLRPGDKVLTRDDGPQEIQWCAAARITRAGLQTHPHLRAIRIRSGAFPGFLPEGDLVVSPSHRLLLKGPQAQMLFGEPEVLVRAGDLVNDCTIHRDFGVAEQRYIHLMLPRHGIVYANGIPAETFHPADMALEDLAPRAKEMLLGLRPELACDLGTYGPMARRCLDRAEAALMVG